MKIVATYVSASSQGQRTHSARTKIPLAPMGVLAPGSARARPSARPPINTSGNFPAHVSAESTSNISPIPSKVVSDVSDPYDNFF